MKNAKLALAGSMDVMTVEVSCGFPIARRSYRNVAWPAGLQSRTIRPPWPVIVGGFEFLARIGTERRHVLLLSKAIDQRLYLHLYLFDRPAFYFDEYAWKDFSTLDRKPLIPTHMHAVYGNAPLVRPTSTRQEIHAVIDASWESFWRKVKAKLDESWLR